MLRGDLSDQDPGSENHFKEARCQVGASSPIQAPTRAHASTKENGDPGQSHRQPSGQEGGGRQSGGTGGSKGSPSTHPFFENHQDRSSSQDHQDNLQSPSRTGCRARQGTCPQARSPCTGFRIHFIILIPASGRLAAGHFPIRRPVRTAPASHPTNE